MINLIETPQRADFKAEYIVNGDKLVVAVDGIEETFDFTGLPEGKSDKIITEVIPVNPIISAEKTSDIVTVKVIRFYSADEKHLFEVIENG